MVSHLVGHSSLERVNGFFFWRVAMRCGGVAIERRFGNVTDQSAMVEVRVWLACKVAKWQNAGKTFNLNRRRSGAAKGKQNGGVAMRRIKVR
jgi:hypothetical protein